MTCCKCAKDNCVFDCEAAAPAKVPRKHAELIKAWADGAKIQSRSLHTSSGWEDSDNPVWSTLHSYRIKPETEPDVVFIQCHKKCGTMILSYQDDQSTKTLQRVKWTTDGETGRIKSVELLDK